MPLLIALAVIVAALLFAVVSWPFALLLRYRMGTSRRRARGWVATINTSMIALSTIIFLVSAAVTSQWVPNLFYFALAGLVGGCLLGLAGLALSRWDVTPHSLHYTPNRWLILLITLVVMARIIHGLWRAWESWPSVPPGAAGSLGAGAIVLGYYLVYWNGVRRRLKRMM